MPLPSLARLSTPLPVLRFLSSSASPTLSLSFIVILSVSSQAQSCLLSPSSRTCLLLLRLSSSASPSSLSLYTLSSLLFSPQLLLEATSMTAWKNKAKSRTKPIAFPLATASSSSPPPPAASGDAEEVLLTHLSSYQADTHLS